MEFTTLYATYDSRLTHDWRRMPNADMAEHVLERAGCLLHYWLTGAEQAPWLVVTTRRDGGPGM